MTNIKHQEIKLLKQSQKSTVVLVREKDSGQLYVHKILRGRHEIYETLQDCPHPYLPKIYEVSFSDDSTSVLEEYIDGESLGVGALSEKAVCTSIKELCSVLQFLHKKGIIHRDIKPSNIIMANDGHIRLIDFDAIRMTKDCAEQDTRLLGTRGYAPPEQYGFAQTDARTDIYSLGVTLQKLLREKANQPKYKWIIKKCTDLNPNKRFGSVEQVRKALSTPYYSIACLLIVLVLAVVLWGVQIYETPKEQELDNTSSSQGSIETSSQLPVAAEVPLDTETDLLFLADDSEQIMLTMDNARQGKTANMQVDMTRHGDVIDFSIGYEANRKLQTTSAKSSGGIDTGLWYSTAEEFLRTIPHWSTPFLENQYEAQITCVDADKDGIKEVFVTRGDGTNAFVTMIYTLSLGDGDYPDTLVFIGTIWGVTTMELTKQGEIIVQLHEQLPRLISQYNKGFLSQKDGIYFSAYKQFQESVYAKNNSLEEPAEFALSSEHEAFFDDLNVVWGHEVERILLTDIIKVPYNTITTAPIRPISGYWEIYLIRHKTV